MRKTPRHWWMGLGEAGCVLILFTFLAPRVIQAQTNGAAPSQRQPTTVTPLPAPVLAMPDNLQPDLVTPAAPDSYIIGDNDLLTIFVYQMPELTRQVRVDSHGVIHLPFVHRGFTAAGITAPQLQREIARELLREGLARSPMVQVVVRQVESKPIVVAGDVATPVTLQAARPMRLMEVLARAGGLNSNAGDTVLISKLRDGKTVTRQINLARLIRYNNQASDPVLHGHDMVTILPARLVYVVGAFRKPGAFRLHMGEPITVLDAIALGQGLHNYPNKGQAVIIRTLPDGSHRQIRIHIGQILLHKAPDLRLRSGDILYVPHDSRRHLLMAALQDVGQIVTWGAAYHIP